MSVIGNRNQGRAGKALAALAMALGIAPAARPAEPTSELIPHETPETVTEVWLVLSEPSLATLPRDATEQRTALRARIVAEQNRVIEELLALGATETGRTQQVENALAVRLPTSSLDAVKKIDGVVKVRPVSERNRIHD